MKSLLRGMIVSGGLVFLWEIIIKIFQLPSFILPDPITVFKTWYQCKTIIIHEAIPTITETLLGLLLGTILACSTAITMVFFRRITLWVLPLLVISQALPTFAIAPLLVIWFGYGLTSKIITTILMLFFPITSAFYDGLRRTDTGWLDLAKTMNAKKWRTFLFVRIPAALPSLATGLRVGTAIAPIGAVVGEWVGASHGLGYLMLNANARMQIDLMFAALFSIIIFSMVLYFSVDKFLKWMIPWQTEW